MMPARRGLYAHYKNGEERAIEGWNDALQALVHDPSSGDLVIAAAIEGFDGVIEKPYPTAAVAGGGWRTQDDDGTRAVVAWVLRSDGELVPLVPWMTGECEPATNVYHPQGP